MSHESDPAQEASPELVRAIGRDLSRVADRTGAPVVATAAITSLVRRRRTRAAVALVAMATALVALGAWWGTRVLRAAPAPAPPSPTQEGLPMGPPSRVPYLFGGQLHVGGDVIATRLRLVGYAGGTTVVGRSGPNGSAWFVVRNGALVRLYSAPVPDGVQLSADGSWIGYATPASRRTWWLQVWDTSTGTPGVRMQVAGGAVCCDASEVNVHGVDNRGRVYFNDPFREWVWSPGRQPVRVTGVDARRIGPEPWPTGGLMVQGRQQGHRDPEGIVGAVDDEGRFTRRGVVPTDQNGTWSPDGSAYLYSTGQSDQTWVQFLDGRAPTLLRLPFPAQLVAWESVESALLQHREVSGRRVTVTLIRCQVDRGACEQAGPALEDPVLPDPS